MSDNAHGSLKSLPACRLLCTWRVFLASGNFSAHSLLVQKPGPCHVWGAWLYLHSVTAELLKATGGGSSSEVIPSLFLSTLLSLPVLSTLLPCSLPGRPDHQLLPHFESLFRSCQVKRVPVLPQMQDSRCSFLPHMPNWVWNDLSTCC